MKTRSFLLVIAAVLTSGILTASAGISNVSGRSAKSAIAKESKLVVVDFNATWCGPCRALKPHLEAMAKQYADQIVILSVDVDKDPKFAAENGVLGIPRVKFFKNGKQVGEFVGYIDQKAVESKIKKALH